MEIKNKFNFSKLKNNGILFVIVLIGAVLMLFPGNDEKKDKNENIEFEQYKFDDEERLKKILSDIKGVGQVSVMITYHSGIETDIAYDTNSTITRRGDGENTTNSEENTDRQAVMSSGEPFVTRLLYPEVKGAIIAAEGAGNVLVKQQIQDAVSAVLDIASHKVFVVEKE